MQHLLHLLVVDLGQAAELVTIKPERRRPFKLPLTVIAKTGVFIFVVWVVYPDRLVLVRQYIAMVHLLVALATESCLHLLDNYVICVAATSSFASGIDAIELPVADFWDVW